MPININFECNLTTVFQDWPNLVWETQTGGGFGQALIARILHSKFFVFSADITRCYFRYLSPEVVTQWFTLIGAALYLVGLYFLLVRKKFPLLLLFLLTPVLVIFKFPLEFFYLGVIGVIVFGLVNLIWRKT
jgi:hypothetical protein